MTRKDGLLALLVVVVWGLNFVVMIWGLATLSPLLLCALRFAAASLPFLLFVRAPKNLSWGLLAAYGLVQGVGQFGLLFTGMKLGMPAGMASVVLQTQAFITMLLAAAYVISELKTAFTIGFLIYIPFLVLDMVISSVLLAMGMMMLPPMMVSMPFKLLLFVMVDGWNLLVGSLVNSFLL